MGKLYHSKKELKPLIEEVLNDLVDSKVSDRQVKLWRGCKTDGIREGFTHCGDETCTQCNNMHRVLKEEMLKMTNLPDGKV